MKRKKYLDYSHIFSISLVIIIGLLLTACGGEVQAKTFTIGVVNLTPALDSAVGGFKARMTELGYNEGEKRQ